MRTNQMQKVINYISYCGSITPHDAFIHLGITKLATVCSDLRLKCGIEVWSIVEKSTNMFGEPCHYKRYFLDYEEYKDYILRRN